MGVKVQGSQKGSGMDGLYQKGSEYESAEVQELETWSEELGQNGSRFK